MVGEPLGAGAAKQIRQPAIITNVYIISPRSTRQPDRLPWWHRINPLFLVCWEDVSMGRASIINPDHAPSSNMWEPKAVVTVARMDDGDGVGDWGCLMEVVVAMRVTLDIDCGPKPPGSSIPDKTGK